MRTLMDMFSGVFRRAPRQVHPRGVARRIPPELVLRAKAPAHPDAVYKKGDMIGGAYEVFGVLGLGGFSVVYLVYSHESEAVYALKTLRDEFLSDKDTREQFRKEAKVWVDLERHPFVVRANFIDELEGRLYIGMEYIPPNEEGINSLEGYLNVRTPDLVQALRWSIQFCQGMEYARSKGIRCHRDVKPANIMLTPENNVKITDFGFADVIGASRAATGAELLSLRRRARLDRSGFGTPTYMPPEQFRNAMRSDERSDIYSYGVVMYQMAGGGRLPFAPTQRIKDWQHDARKVWDEMHRMHTEQPVAPLQSPLFPIIRTCLQKEPSKRYQTFRELRVDLENLLRHTAGEIVAPLQSRELEAWELYNKAFSLSSLGDLAGAIQVYDRVIEIEPGNTDAWNNKGVCLRKLNKNVEALACYESSIKADRYNASAWSNRGNSLYTLGRFTEAIISLNKAIEIDPLNESAWLNKGLAEERLGLRTEAAISIKRFLDLKPVAYAAHVEFAKKKLSQLRGGGSSRVKP